MSDTPTAQAIKAANALRMAFGSIVTTQQLANVIDEATGLPGLVQLAQTIVDGRTQRSPDWLVEVARAALKGNPQ